MRIDRLELECFRNYVRQSADFDPRCNVIFGENAQGKTNLLEALVYLSCGKSPRARTDREMIGFDADAARMCARVSARERAFQIQVDLFRDRRRKISVNQVPAKSSAALSEVYHTVFFCPEDLYLIREGAAARRIRLCASSVPGTPPPWRSITGPMTTRPAFCGMRRSGRTCWRLCRILMRGWCGTARCSSTTASSLPCG